MKMKKISAIILSALLAISSFGAISEIKTSAAPAPNAAFTSLSVSGGYLYGVPRGTKAGDLTYAFSGQSVSVSDASGSSVGDNTVVATGYKISNSGGSLAIVIDGDTDGTGSLNNNDYLSVKLHFKGAATLSGANLKAADVNGDGKISISDYIMIKRHISGTYNINRTVKVEKTVVSGASKWINTIKDNSVIMSESQILSHNNTILSRNTDCMVNLANYPSALSSSTLTTYIENATSAPTGKYNANKQQITSTMISSYKNNRNLSGIQSSNATKKGVVVQRSMLRSLPTLTAFYDTTSGNYFGNFDRIQETGLSVGMPVYVLHKSSDEKWYFVQSYFYRGWVSVSDVALCSSASDWNEYYSPSDFAVITDALLTVSGKKLDMSTKLPLISENSFSYTVKLPSRNSSGYLANSNVTIAKTSANHGYLPYTRENVYNQAFKYLGTGYGWGDMVDGVDCTSFCANVYRCFGFMFPRNSGEQQDSVGLTVKTISGTNTQRYNALASYANPYPIYKSGHCMIYLGQLNGTHYIIHANATTMSVAETNMDNVISALTYVDIMS